MGSSTAVPDPPPIGIVVNPRSGTDVRRAIAAAGSVTVEAKANVVRRVVLGAREAGARQFVVHRDPHRIVARATETVRGIELDWVDEPMTFGEQDAVNAVTHMRAAGCAVVVVLGGDGTNRAVAGAWPDVTVVPVSTGTNNAFPVFVEATAAGTAASNNAFPVFVEATAAGTAAGHLVAGRVGDRVGRHRAKVVRLTVTGADGAAEAPDLALIDAVTARDPYVGALDLFDPATLGVAVLTRADPALVGFAGVGGLLDPLGPDEDAGLLLRFGPAATAPRVVRGPTAPGHFDDLGLTEVRRLMFGEPVDVEGPTLLAFDGERKRRLVAGASAVLRVERDGPWVVDVAAVMRAAVAGG